MAIVSESPRRLLPLALGLATLAALVLLFAQDAAPHMFPPRSHDLLAAFSLAAIALAYLMHQFARRPVFPELAKAILLAAAFLFWAANQYWPNLPQAALFNDIAIGLFVLDVFLVIAGWPAAAREGVPPESGGRCGDRCDCGCRCGAREAASERFEALVRSLRYVDAGRHFTRGELNER